MSTVIFGGGLYRPSLLCRIVRIRSLLRGLVVHFIPLLKIACVINILRTAFALVGPKSVKRH